jgi:hypothetical protein
MIFFICFYLFGHLTFFFNLILLHLVDVELELDLVIYFGCNLFWLD